MDNRLIVGVIGPNKSGCTEEVYEFSKKLGRLIIDEGYFLACGGMEGVMEAAAKGAHESEKYRYGKTIGIIPGTQKGDANPFIDIVIPTGIGYARNKILINTADILVAVSGGAGTLSEIAFSWQEQKYVLCHSEFEGWAKRLAGEQLDSRYQSLLIETNSLNQIQSYLEIFKTHGTI